MNLKLQMRLSQQLIMTPQLQQAIKLLQLSRVELEELIDQALVENPVLEESAEHEAAPEESDEAGRLREEREAAELRAKETGLNDQEWQQYIESGSGVINERYSSSEGDEPNLEATLATADSLPDHLSWQLEMSNLSPIETALGEQMIGNLDEDGYLTVSLGEIFHWNPEMQAEILQEMKKGGLRLPIPEFTDSSLFDSKHQSQEKAPPRQRKKRGPKEAPVFEEDAVQEEDGAVPMSVDPAVVAVAEGVLRFIQTFDPTGVGARNLQECLQIQLRAMKLEDQLPYAMVTEDLKLLESKDLRRIARRHKVELEEVVDAYKLIMSLEPKPGRPFGGDRPQHIIPDVFIFKTAGENTENENQVGHYRVVLNESGIPRLRINDYYRRLSEVNTAGDGSLTREYIQEKIKAGNWLMKSIEQRQKTILKVTRSILKHQYEFFEKGISHLRPLVLKDVAEDIQVHESTVSRITTNKYVHSPQGLFELKYFFTSGIDQGQGEVISSKKIKDMIQRIIEGEDVKEPLTDIQIADILFQKSKIRVARRTVAKYREALNLLPSNRRKQMF
ncbi:MAG: RNA polymerase factor sigma-54 [Deltaproteobacteria bacterium]|nr:RNA polymerase factor sigma-54 [Deltaproteobacteria bacterium]